MNMLMRNRRLFTSVVAVALFAGLTFLPLMQPGWCTPETNISTSSLSPDGFSVEAATGGTITSQCYGWPMYYSRSEGYLQKDSSLNILTLLFNIIITVGLSIGLSFLVDRPVAHRGLVEGEVVEEKK